MFCNKNKISIYNFDGLRETVKSFVKEKRYIHILGVESEAVKLAGIFGLDEDTIKKVRAAALLHDITKEFDIGTQFEIFREYNINLSDDEKNAEWSFHAKTGAYIARFEFDADDIIFGGIYNHTDKSDLLKSPCLFNKIISLADWIEPNRTYQECVDAREHFYRGLSKAESFEDKNKAIGETLFVKV